MKRLVFISAIFFVAWTLPNFAAPVEIIEAAKWGDAGKVKKLLQKNPGLIKVTDEGIRATALHWAAIYGKKEVVKVILPFNPDVNTQEVHEGTTMHWAAHYDDPQVIGWLLDHGAKIDHVNRYGRTPLLVAARRGCKGVVKILLKRGADIKATIRDGSSALHIAARNGHTDVIKYLLAQGADPEIKNQQGQTYMDVLFKCPKTIPIEAKIVSNCAGLYERSGGRKMIIREENNRLYYYAYGKDELVPIGPDQFIMSAERGMFTFLKNQNQEITGLLYKIGNSEFRAKKIQPLADSR